MKLILYQATFAITEIDFVPGPFRCQIEQQHLDFAVGSIYTNIIRQTPASLSKMQPSHQHHAMRRLGLINKLLSCSIAQHQH